MGILQKALLMLEKYPLCDHCLGRQFALLGHGIENDKRGESIKLVLTLKAHAFSISKNKEGEKTLRILAMNGFSKVAEEMLRKTGKRTTRKNRPRMCFLCKDKFKHVGNLAKKALSLLEHYEFRNFLVGIELPVASEEIEDEFRAEFGVNYGESMRNEFGRLIGKKIAEGNGKPVEFMKPEMVALLNPYTGEVKIQANPLFMSGRYTKLARGIPQSKWFCTSCRGKGCERCNGTGKMYPESVEEIIGKPLLEITGGQKSSFHASGREDIDARMLGNGRPFVIEITKPLKRFLDLKKIEKAVNSCGQGKVQVSNLKFADRDIVRKLKKGESTQKEYSVTMEFESRITLNDLRLVERRLTNAAVNQRTPIRVLNRRADLLRERYIYEVNVKKLAPKKAEMRVRCQGGLYVKELVTGDEGRTTPSVAEILKIRVSPAKLDVLNVIMGD
jgi:tRNA pseudouridine synthase 10